MSATLQHLLQQHESIKAEIEKKIHHLDALNTAFKTSHPHICKDCDGEGGTWKFYSGDLENPPEEDFDPCPSCLDQNRDPNNVQSILSEDQINLWLVKEPDERHLLAQELDDLHYLLSDLEDRILLEKEG